MTGQGLFGSSLLDVALGVVATFLLVSLIASAVTEAISAVLALRHNTLRTGVQALLNDPKFDGLALKVYNHALVSPFGNGIATTVADLRHLPAYIDPHQFGTALLDVLQTGAGTGDLMTSIANDQDMDRQLKQTLLALGDRATRLRTHLVDEVAAWFDDAMDRLGGWYKRRVQLIGFLVALVLAAILNADALHVGMVLWDRPVMAAHAPTGTDVGGLLKSLDETNALIGWHDPDAMNSVRKVAFTLFGWSLTAFATLFGAAFWFDLLQRIVQVRATGTTPDEKLDATAART